MIELAGRLCYRSFQPGLNPNVTKVREDPKAYIGNILKSGHGSVLEHVNATFLFHDVSRVFTHELVRHRAGCAYSQESLRYVRLDDIRFWVPDSLQPDDADDDAMRVAKREARRAFEDQVEGVERTMRVLTQLFKLDDPNTNFATKKKITSMMRRIAPLGLATSILATFNLRALRHIITMRCSNAAEEEIQKVFRQHVAPIAHKQWPMAFQDMFERVDGVDFNGNEKV